MRGSIQDIDLNQGDKVRKYSDDEWFHEGLVTEIDLVEGFVDVDFADWVQRYPIAALRVYWPPDGTYERCLVSMQPGEIVYDYRMDA